MLLDGIERQPVDGINGGEVKLLFSCNSELSLRTFAANYLQYQCLVQAYGDLHSLCNRSHFPDVLHQLVAFSTLFQVPAL